MIESEQQHTDEEKTYELRKHDCAAGKKSGGGSPRPVGAKVSLHQILIRAMCAHRQKAATDNSGPKCVSLCQIDR